MKVMRGIVLVALGLFAFTKNTSKIWKCGRCVIRPSLGIWSAGWMMILMMRTTKTRTAIRFIRRTVAGRTASSLSACQRVSLSARGYLKIRQ